MPERPCSLCGEVIVDNPSDQRLALADQHVPALQFYPKSLRPEIRGQLWKVPAHRKCNEGEKLDEEYFIQFFCPLVAVQNKSMGTVLIDELRRRAKQPQTKGLIRRLLKEMKTVTSGGIVLPAGVFKVEPDVRRVQNMVVNIARCLFYKDHDRYVPRANCFHVKFCQNPEDVQELFALLRGTSENSVLPSVFRYWHASFDGMYLYSMLFWDAFMFCVGFRDPKEIAAEDEFDRALASTSDRLVGLAYEALAEHRVSRGAATDCSQG
jgi:hypothetical protein